MHRVIFFGMDGPFSAVPLAALAASELKPILVVQGVDEGGSPSRPRIDHLPARPGLLERLQGRLRPTMAEKIGRGLAAAARGHGLDVLRTTHANDPVVLARLRALEPDAFLVAGFPHLFSPQLLGLARLGGLNLHPGRLPEERGPAPLFWALAEGRTTVTVTLHVLDRGEDTGDVVAAKEMSFEPGLDAQDILALLGQTMAPLAVRSLRALLAGDLVRVPQRKENAGRRPRPKFRDGRIDPRRTAREVYTFVAACARHHSLHVECGGDRFFIARAVSFDPEARLDFEYALTGDRLLLRCHPGLVELELREDGALFSSEYTPAEGER